MHEVEESEGHIFKGDGEEEWVSKKWKYEPFFSLQ